MPSLEDQIVLANAGLMAAASVAATNIDLSFNRKYTVLICDGAVLNKNNKEEAMNNDLNDIYTKPENVTDEEWYAIDISDPLAHQLNYHKS